MIHLNTHLSKRNEDVNDSFVDDSKRNEDVNEVDDLNTLLLKRYVDVNEVDNSFEHTLIYQK